MENKKVNFEKELERLKEIVDTIQDETLPLEKSIALYEEGKRIIAMLEELLNESESKVENIVSIEK